MNDKCYAAYMEGYNNFNILCSEYEIIDVTDIAPLHMLKEYNQLTFRKQCYVNCILSNKSISENSVLIDFNQMFNIEIDGHSNGMDFCIKIKSKVDDSEIFSYYILKISVPVYQSFDDTNQLTCNIINISTFIPTFNNSDPKDIDCYLDIQNGIVSTESKNNTPVLDNWLTDLFE